MTTDGRSLPEDPYAVLGIPPEGEDNEIRAAYRRALRQHPPERDAEGFKRIRQAYEAVEDADARVAFVLFGGVRLPPLPPLIPEDLGARPVPPVSRAEVVALVERLALVGTDLDSSVTCRDLRDPPE